MSYERQVCYNPANYGSYWTNVRNKLDLLPNISISREDTLFVCYAAFLLNNVAIAVSFND